MSFPLKFDKLEFAEHAAEIMVYFEKHKLIDIMTRIISEVALVRPEDPRLWMAANIKRIAHDIYSDCLEKSAKFSSDVTYFQLPGKFLYRIAIHGRRGSGRKTQASALVQRLNLVYIDAEQVMYNCLKGMDNLGEELRNTFTNNDVRARSKTLGKVISQRLLQMDALHQGWVMVNFPRNLFELQLVFEHFKIPPNKFVFLDCGEGCAKQRLLARPSTGRPKDRIEYIEQEMKYFALHEAEVNDYLARRHETICVNATCCLDAVKTDVMSKLECRAYVMGFKK